MKKQYIPVVLATIVLLALSACKKEYTSPSAANSNQVFSTAAGMTGVVIGLQRTYTQANSIYYRTAITGLTTNELLIRNTGNISEAQFANGGGNVDGTNPALAAFWASSNKIIYDANQVITNAALLGDKGYASGLIAYATIFKVLAAGNLAMYWQNVPAAIGSNVTFTDRITGYGKAITDIDNALAAIQANAVSTVFTTNVPAGIDIVNTLHALKARYALFSANYTTALTEANAVDLTKRSAFIFDAVNPNPIYSNATSTNNIFQPIDSTMGLPVPIQPALADRRVPFYIAINTTIAPRFRINGFGAATTTASPVYLPGEITLIKAEAYARQSTPDLNNALIQLNNVVTKTPASDLFGVGANLPALTGTYTQSQLLTMIYMNRCIELYMSGLKIEDIRRFGRPDSETKRNFFPYPFTERYNNPNTPADPAF